MVYVNYNAQTAVRPGYTQLKDLGDPLTQKALEEFDLARPGASFQERHDYLGHTEVLLLIVNLGFSTMC